MQTLLEQVTDNIERTAELYEEILDTELQKQSAIVESRIDALPGIVAREEELVGRADGLEAERLGLRACIAEDRPELGPSPRLHQVVETLVGPERDRLEARHHHLLALAAEIGDVNRTNFHLLRSSLDFLRECLDSVFGSPADPATYRPDGRGQAPGHPPTRLDHLL